MPKIKDDVIKPTGTLKINKVYLNKKNNQLTVLLPKKKLKGVIPSKLEVIFWK